MLLEQKLSGVLEIPLQNQDGWGGLSSGSVCFNPSSSTATRACEEQKGLFPPARSNCTCRRFDSAPARRTRTGAARSHRFRPTAPPRHAAPPRAPRPKPKWPLTSPFPDWAPRPTPRWSSMEARRTHPSGSVRQLRPHWLRDAPPRPACRCHWLCGGLGWLSLATEVSLPLSPLRGPRTIFHSVEGGRGGGSGGSTVLAERQAAEDAAAVGAAGTALRRRRPRRGAAVGASGRWAAAGTRAVRPPAAGGGRSPLRPRLLEGGGERPAPGAAGRRQERAGAAAAGLGRPGHGGQREAAPSGGSSLGPGRPPEGGSAAARGGGVEAGPPRAAVQVRGRGRWGRASRGPGAAWGGGWRSAAARDGAARGNSPAEPPWGAQPSR